jgi:hypothetical protein
LHALIALFVLAGAHRRPLPPPPPPPDPMTWWTGEQPLPTEAADPLRGRRLLRGETPIPMTPGADPSLYRLWGLQPLQTQLVRRGELILEVWIRPSEGVRQAIVRLTLRRDGRAFVSLRAGLGCCTAEIGRRIGADAELPPESAARLRALAALPAWDSPRSVSIDYGDGALEGLCVNGDGYDVTLVEPGRARHLHRLCEPEAVGQIADVLEAAVGAALGREPRFDVLFPRGADFSRERAAYQSLLAHHGRLVAARGARPQPPMVPEPPDEEDPAPLIIPPPWPEAQAAAPPAAAPAVGNARPSR